MLFLFSINYAFTQLEQNIMEAVIVSSRDGIPIKAILVLNAVLVKNSITSVRLRNDLKNYKIKIHSEKKYRTRS